MKLDLHQILALLRYESTRLSTAACLAEYGFAGHRASIEGCAARISELTALLGAIGSAAPAPAAAEEPSAAEEPGPVETVS